MVWMYLNELLFARRTLLVSAGGLKRKAITDNANIEGEELANLERKVLVQGACNNILPKLVHSDLDVFSSILEDVFPGSQVRKIEDEKLAGKLDEICKTFNYTPADQWVQKILQLKVSSDRLLLTIIVYRSSEPFAFLLSPFRW